MGDPWGALSRGIKKQKAVNLATAKAEETAEKDAKAEEKQIASGLKNKLKAYKTRAASYVSDDGSPLKLWQESVKNSVDELEMYIANPSLLPANQNIDIDEWMLTAEEDFKTLLKNNGGSIEAAGKAPIQSVDELFKQENLKAEKSELKDYKENIWDNLDDEEKTIVSRQTTTGKKIIEKGIYKDYNTYVRAIREQFETEDKMLTENPGIKGELARIKTLLNRYDASILWGRFKHQNKTGGTIVAFLKESMGTTPIVIMDKEAEIEYAKLNEEYTNLIFDVTGFKTHWNPLPMDFQPVVGATGQDQSYMAFPSSDTEVVNWTTTQIKDRNELIEYAAAGHISKDIENMTGLDINQFNTAIDSILANPESYHSSFIHGLETLNETIDYIIEQTDIDLDELTYQKRKFLTGSPIPKTKTVADEYPGAAQIEPYLGN